MNFAVVVYTRVAGPGLRDASRILASAGFHSVIVTDPEQFRAKLGSMNCAVVLAYELTTDLIPRRLDGARVPPIVLISPLPFEKATGTLKDSRVVQALLNPTLRIPPQADQAFRSKLTRRFAPS